VYRAFTLNAAPKSNVMWLTMPQDAGYATASDIVIELEGGDGISSPSTKINVVGRWNPSGQFADAYFYDTDYLEWGGSDFVIGPGDGIYLSILSSFNWVTCGVDIGSMLTFTLNAAPKSNVMWFNLATTSTYTTASQIVQALEGGDGVTSPSTKINVVGKWNAAGQFADAYFYDTDYMEWGGSNFAIAPGDGLYLSIISTFTWTPAMITPIVP